MDSIIAEYAILSYYFLHSKPKLTGLQVNRYFTMYSVHKKKQN